MSRKIRQVSQPIRFASCSLFGASLLFTGTRLFRHGTEWCACHVSGLLDGEAAAPAEHAATLAEAERSALWQLAGLLQRCPDKGVYRIVNVPQMGGDLVYDRETRRLGVEIDPSSGFAGTIRHATEKTIRQVAAAGGRLSDFPPMRGIDGN